MKKAILLLFILSGISKFVIAQDSPYSTVTNEELNMKNYAKDTSAHAVVLRELGKSTIEVDNDNIIKVIYEYQVKIKVFDIKDFDKGTVQIALYNNNEAESYESVEDIKGVTYYKDDNGTPQKVELENSKIYFERENKHWSTYKFAMPGVRNGCVFVYKYRIKSPYFENFHSWQFQDKIPKAYSEYDARIPALWHYNTSLKGSLSLTISKSSIEPNCFSINGSAISLTGESSDCSILVYGMSDIPAFIEEDYMTSPKNFLSVINFELIEYTNPYDGTKIKRSKEWNNIDYNLKNDTYFGSQLKRKGLFKDRLIPVLAGITGDLDKARAIYAYLQKWFKWNNFHGIYSDGLGKPFDAHTGSVADINLSLVTALSAAGLDAEPVLLSTRDNGAINMLYPLLGDFNYVIAKVNIADKSYLLDATNQLLPFGVLSFKCLNDKGRVMCLDKPSYWIDLNMQQKAKSSTTLDLTLQEDGKLKGTVFNYEIGYKAYEKREEIKKFNTVNEYVEKLNSESPKIRILKSEITNLDSLNQPLTEKYEVEIDIFDKPANRLSFNPFFWSKLNVNPFKSAVRFFPVDMGMARDERFILIIHLPDQYMIETPPQVLSIGMPDNGGKFLTNYEPDNNTFTFSQVIQLNKPIYSPDDYPYLKEFYNKIIQSEKPEMIFKKK